MWFESRYSQIYNKRWIEQNTKAKYCMNFGLVYLVDVRDVNCLSWFYLFSIDSHTVFIVQFIRFDSGTLWHKHIQIVKGFHPYYLVYESLDYFVYLSCVYVFLYIFICVFDFLLGYAATQLARQVQQERTQVVCSNKVAQKRLARRHSRNGPLVFWFDLKLRGICTQCKQTFFVLVESRYTVSAPRTAGTHKGGVK